MSARRESPPRRPAPPPPDLADDEVDLGRYWASVAARWWLPILGLVLGALIGYLSAVAAQGRARRERARPHRRPDDLRPVREPEDRDADRAGDGGRGGALVARQAPRAGAGAPRLALRRGEARRDRDHRHRRAAPLGRDAGPPLDEAASQSGANRRARPCPDARRRDEDDRPQQAEIRRRGRRPRAADRHRRGASLGAARGPRRPPPGPVASAGGCSRASASRSSCPRTTRSG